MRVEVIPKLLATMMQVGQYHPRLDVLFQDIM